MVAAGMAGLELSDEIDPRWRDLTTRELGVPAPATLRDRPLETDDEKVSPAVRDVVAEVKAHVFPHHGLDVPASRNRRS